MKSVSFLDYTIKMSSDGVVIVKDGVNVMPGAMNFGKVWDEKALNNAKHSATILFMIDRPLIFDASLYYRLIGKGGSYHEHGLLKVACKDAGLPVPKELETPIDGMNRLIGFNGQPLNMGPQ